jgi:hypothetical protein
MNTLAPDEHARQLTAERKLVVNTLMQFERTVLYLMLEMDNDVPEAYQGTGTRSRGLLRERLDVYASDLEALARQVRQGAV